MHFHWMVVVGLLVGPGQAHAQDMSHSAAGTVKAVVTPIMRSGKTISGQPLRLPQGESEVAAAAIEIPVGGSIPIHKHPWSRLVYVERGTVTIINHDTGASLDFKAGQLLPEVVEQWHEGRAKGTAPVRLVVIDLVPPGVNNTIMKPVPTERGL